MKSNLVAFVVGFIFSLGLGISGMTQPQKVIGFLNFGSLWDSSLLLVMMGAVGIHFLSYQVAKKLKTPFFAPKWYVPNKTLITGRLIIGAALFGIGWGLAGYCPGPALVSLVTFAEKTWLFFISMIGGMLIFRFVDHRWKLNR